MREQLERLVEWVKAHPWLAALIVGGVLLLGYIAYKRSAAGGGGGGDSTFAPAEPSPDTGFGLPPISGGAAGGGGGGGLPEFPVPAETGGSEAISPVNPLAHQFREQPFEFKEPSFQDAFSGLGYSDSAQFASYATPTVAGTAAETLGKIPVGGYEPEGTVRLPGGRVISQQLLEQTTEEEQLAPGVRRAKPLRKPRRKPLPTVGGKTPSQLVGKGKHFTGYYKGIWYVNGYPVIQTPLPTPIPGGAYTLAGGRVASGQILGINNGGGTAHTER